MFNVLENVLGAEDSPHGRSDLDKEARFKSYIDWLGSTLKTLY